MRDNKFSNGLPPALLASLLLALCTITASAQTVSVVAYDGDGFTLISSLVQGRDGNLYGTQTDNDVPNYYGSAFKVTPSGTLTVLHKFCSQTNCTDGAYPGVILLGTDGNFYGITEAGGDTTGPCGSFGCGTVFKLTPSGTFTLLHTFTGPDGISPTGLIEGTDRNLYGTAFGDGSICCGTIFKITTTGTITTLHNFDQADGSGPQGLVQGMDGNLYGTTYIGGKYDPYPCYGGCGTVFKSTTGGAFTSLHSFQVTDGYTLYAPVSQASDGTLYGTTWSGPTGDGTIFSITPTGQAKTVYTFTGIGANPYVEPIPASDGNLYGTTLEGGSPCSYGFIYSVSQADAFTTVYDSCQNDGFTSALMQNTNGMFYGTAGPAIYSLDTSLAPFITFVVPGGKVGQTIEILGQGLTGTTSVTFNGIPATSFKVNSDTYLTAVVPSEATTGPVVVTTPTGTLTSSPTFQLLN
jgi:uncharacterized repeat protein (TIGR03803 family)